MADTTSTDTSTIEDTSTNEEDLLAELEADDTSFDDVDDDDEAEGSDESDTDAEASATEDEDDSDDDAEADAGDETDDSTESEETQPTQEQDQERILAEAERKRYNDEMARQRIAEKQAREQRKREEQQAYIEQAEDQKDLALRQLQVEAYNNKIENNTAKLQTSLERAVASIDLFRTGTPAVQQRLLRAVDQFESMHVVKDDNGDPIEVRGDVYQYLQDEANSIRELLGDGAKQQVTAKAKQKQRTLTPPVRTPKKPAVDPDLAAFDEEASSW